MKITFVNFKDFVLHLKNEDLCLKNHLLGRAYVLQPKQKFKRIILR